MSDSPHGSTDEKATTITEDTSKGGFFSRKKSTKPVEQDKPQDTPTEAENDLAPVSFLSLFRCVGPNWSEAQSSDPPFP